MYTALSFNSRLKEDVSQKIIEILAYMIGDGEDEPTNLPKHPLFGNTRWRHMLRCDSYYFDADTHSTLRYDDIASAWYLCVRSNLKNYDSEIQKFVNWVTPYLDKEDGEFLGFYRYEENVQPTLLFHNKPAIHTSEFISDEGDRLDTCSLVSSEEENPDLMVIAGSPKSGKTTRLLEIAARENAIFVTSDTIYAFERAQSLGLAVPIVTVSNYKRQARCAPVKVVLDNILEYYVPEVFEGEDTLVAFSVTVTKR